MGLHRYFAFISYNKKDKKWAEFLQKRLERYRLPSSLQKKFPACPDSLCPIFRDLTDLDSGVLIDEIRDALKASKYLIVICTPDSARSSWVNREVEEFVNDGRVEDIIPLIVRGIPNSGTPEDECFPESLRKLSTDQELLGININDLGREAAIYKVVARMLKMPFDEIWQRYERGRKLRRRMTTLLLAVIILIMTSIASYVNMLNRSLKINHSRYVAENTEKIIFDKGLMPALKILLEVAPPRRPYSFEVECAVRSTYHKYLCGSYVQLNRVSQADSQFLSYVTIGNDNLVVFTEKSIQVRDLTSMSIKDSLSLESDQDIQVCAVNPYPDLHEICFSTSHGEIRMCSLNKGTISSIKTVGNQVGICKILPIKDKAQIVSISSDSIILWDIHTRSKVLEIGIDYHNISDAVVSDTGLLAVAADGKTIFVYDLGNLVSESVNILTLIDRTVTSLAFRPGTDILACSTNEKSIYIWNDLRDTNQYYRYPLNTITGITHVMFSTDGGYLLAVADRFVRVMTADDMMELPYSPLDNIGSITTLSVDRVSKTLLTGAFDGCIRLWDMNTGHILFSYQNDNWTKSVDFNDDCSRFVFLSSDSSFSCWKTNGHSISEPDYVEYLSVLQEWDQNKAVMMSPNGNYRATLHGSEIRIKNLKQNISVVCYGHKGKVNCVAFSPDSKLLVSGGTDNTVRVWSTENGKEITPAFIGHERSVIEVGFNPEMSEVVSVSLDRTRRHWPFEPYSELLKDCHQLTQAVYLTEEELKRYYIY